MSNEIEQLKQNLSKERGLRCQAEQMYHEANNRLLSNEQEIGKLRGRLEVYSTLNNHKNED